MATKPGWKPNERTLQTMEKSERDEEVYHAKDADDLFAKLGIGGMRERVAGLAAPAQVRAFDCAQGRDDNV
jgi:hypothetical protein